MLLRECCFATMPIHPLFFALRGIAHRHARFFYMRNLLALHWLNEWPEGQIFSSSSFKLLTAFGSVSCRPPQRREGRGQAISPDSIFALLFFQHWHEIIRCWDVFQTCQREKCAASF
jgi:hypothetical protein